MAFLFGASRRDQVHLVSTLQSLTPTSVVGLAAALSWSERKTERILREVAGAHGSLVAFDPHRRTVALRVDTPAPPAVSISGGHAAPSAPVFAAPRSAAPAPAPAAIPPGPGARCPSCQVRLLPTASGGAAVCPQCGQFSTRASRSPAPVSTGPAPPASSSASVPMPVESGRTVVHSGDRRSQELFAAWVTARPIPCPRCRTSLRHRGVGEYGCPSCGHRVTFETSVSGIGRTATGPVPKAS